MLKADCILINTEYLEGVRKYMRYMAADMVANGRKPSFKAMYRMLEKEGLKTPIETFGLHYNEMANGREGFTSAEDVAELSTAEFEQEVFGKMMDFGTTDAEGKPQDIGDLSPEQAVLKQVVDLFKGDNGFTQKTKTTLRKMQDLLTESMRRTVKDNAPAKGQKDTRTWQEMLKDGLERMGTGERTLDGTINNMTTLFNGFKAEVKQLADRMRASGELDAELEADRLEAHAQSFTDMVFSVALNGKEAKKVIDGIMVGEGFAKLDKDGNLVIDRMKESGETASAAELRKKVVDAMVKNGFERNTAERIGDNFNRELVEREAENLEMQKAKYAKEAKTYDKKVTPTSLPNIDDTVRATTKRWDNFKRYVGQSGAPLILARSTADKALHHIYEKAGFTVKGANGKVRFSKDALAKAIDSPADISAIARDYFKQLGYKGEQLDGLTDAMTEMVYDSFDKLKEHVVGRQQAIEDTWQPPTTAAKPTKTVPDLIRQRMQDFAKYQTLTGDNMKNLVFRMGDAKKILGEAVKQVFSKEVAGKEAIDWRELGVKRPDEAALKQMVVDYALKEGFTQLEADAIAESVKDLYPEMVADIDLHAGAIIESKKRAMDREAPQRKSALRQLAELKALGLFDSQQHQALIDRMLGTDTQAADIAEIKSILDANNKFMAETGTQEMHGDYAEALFKRQIDNIVKRSRDDRSGLLRTSRYMYNAVALNNMTLIANPFNLAQNMLSGGLTMLEAAYEVKKQTGLSFFDRKLFSSILKDAGMGGVSGEAQSKFGSTGILDDLNSLNFKKNPVKALATSYALFARTALQGFDAAAKASLANKGFIMNMHEALVRNGWDKRDATDHIYKMLYGEGRETARADAEKLIRKYRDEMGIGESEYAIKRATERLADDIVKSNIDLSTQPQYVGDKPPITFDVVEAAYNAGKRGAAVALGHEANNIFSRSLSAGRQKANARYEKYMSQGDYTAAATQSMINTLYFDNVNKLAGGGSNWAVLTAERTGVRLLSTIPGLRKAEAMTWDLENPESLQRAMEQRTLYTKQRTRAFSGMLQAAAILGAQAAYGLLSDEEKARDNMGTIGNVIAAPFSESQEKIDNSNAAQQFFKRTAGPLALAVYLYNKAGGKGESNAIGAGTEFLTQTFNLNPEYSIGAQVKDATRSYYKGEEDKGAAKVGRLLGSYIPSVPGYSAYRSTYKLGNELITGEQPTPVPLGESFTEGYFYKSMIGDILHSLPKDYLEAMGLEEFADEGGKSKTMGKYKSRR